MDVAKKLIRTAAKRRLESLSPESIAQQSTNVSKHVQGLPQYANARTISIFIPMKNEIQTLAMIENALSAGKRVFVPKVLGKKSTDMTMVPISSLADIEMFPKNAWGIPEPPDELARAISDDEIATIDTLILPGVGFTKEMCRLGHGKGYYDCFLNKLQQLRERKGLSAPYLIAVSLDEQILEEIPTEEHDKMMNVIVTSSSIYTATNENVEV